MTEKKLHLGCGSKFLKGFIHVDLADYSHIDHRSNINDLSFIDNESIDLIYACHVFEYFSVLDRDNLLIEWKKKLKKGGILKLSVPNFDSILEVYLKNRNIEDRGILGPLYGFWQNPDSEVPLFHKIAYNLRSIEALLQRHNFKNIQLYEYSDFLDDDYDDFSKAYIPHMDKTGILMSINIEAQK